MGMGMGMADASWGCYWYVRESVCVLTVCSRGPGWVGKKGVECGMAVCFSWTWTFGWYWMWMGCEFRMGT